MRPWSKEDLEQSLQRGDASRRSPDKGPPPYRSRPSPQDDQGEMPSALAELKSKLPDGIEEALQGCEEPVLGVDPGIETGTVIYDEGLGEIVDVLNATFWQVVILMALARDLDVTFWAYIEDPSLNNFTYGRHGMSGAKRDKLNRNVGRNQAFGELLVEGAELMGHVARPVKPESEKWSAEKCKQITGYPLATDNPFYNNQHVRDALRALYKGGVFRAGDLSYLEDTP